VQNTIFNLESTQPGASRNQRWLSYVLIFGLISASTAAMMFCACDTVGIHDYNAISLVALATVFGIAAAYLAYRRMQLVLGITGFLRAVAALAIVGVSVYVELLVAMEVVARLARWR